MSPKCNHVREPGPNRGRLEVYAARDCHRLLGTVICIVASSGRSYCLSRGHRTSVVVFFRFRVTRQKCQWLCGDCTPSKFRDRCPVVSRDRRRSHLVGRPAPRSRMGIDANNSRGGGGGEMSFKQSSTSTAPTRLVMGLTTTTMRSTPEHDPNLVADLHLLSSLCRSTSTTASGRIGTTPQPGTGS